LLCKVGLELFESNEVGVKYGFILGLKKLLLLKSISQTNTNKRQKAIKQTKKKEKSKQAYTRVDLHLDDS